MHLLHYSLFFLYIGVAYINAEDCPRYDKVVFCYFSSWAVYREGNGHFNISHIEPDMCTHLVYAFSGLSIYGGIESLDPTFDMANGGFSSFVALREQNPCLKTLLAIGGWNQGSRPYSVMVSDAGYRKAFIESVLRLLAVYKFDGLDIDWEYPTARGGIPQDRENFGKLLIELNEKLKMWDLMLTIAVTMDPVLAAEAYDMTAINEAVDYVLIMGYDYTSTTSSVTGLSSPMSAVRVGVEFWMDNVDIAKLVLGVPAYGRTFNLMDPSLNGVGAPTNGTGTPGLFTRESGFLAYYEVIANLRSGRFTMVKVPQDENYYAFLDTEWMTFELADNYEAKANYVMERNIGGMMVWSIDTDNFFGSLNSTHFPIVNIIRSVLMP